MAVPPWPTNIAPQPGMGGPKQVEISTLFRFSLRSPDTAVDLGTLYTALGYGGTVYRPDGDLLLPEDVLQTETAECVLEGFNDWSGPAGTVDCTREVVEVVPPSSCSGTHQLELLNEGEDEKEAPRNFYTWSEVLASREGFLAEAHVYQPITDQNGARGRADYYDNPDYGGLMVGVAHGPSNRGVFVFFCDASEDGDPSAQYLVVTGPATDNRGARQFLAAQAFQWWDPTQEPRMGAPVPTVRVSVSWNLSSGRDLVEVAIGHAGQLPIYPDTKVLSLPVGDIVSFSQGARLGGHVPLGTERAFLLVGTEAQRGRGGRGGVEDIGNAVLPFAGLLPYTGAALTAGLRHSGVVASVWPNEHVCLPRSEDPRQADVAPWVDGMLTGSVVPGSTDLTLRKSAADDALLPAALSRTELMMGEGDLRPTSWRVFVRLLARDVVALSTNSTGMGLAVSDGTRLYHLALLTDYSDRFVGLLRGIRPHMEADYAAVEGTDWTDEVTLQLLVHRDSGQLDIYVGDEDVTPALSLPADDGLWPEIAAEEPGISIGHLLPQHMPSGTSGDLVIREFWYTESLDGYEARWGTLPTAMTPAWTLMDTPAGSGTLSLEGGDLIVAGDPGQVLVARSLVGASPENGFMWEWRGRVTAWSDPAGSPNPTGQPVYASTVYDNIEDLVALAGTLRSDGSCYVYLLASNEGQALSDVLAQNEDGRARSFELDWREDHTYRMEYKPELWVRLYVDNNPIPAIDLVWEDRDLPSGGLGPVPLVGMGKWDVNRSATLALKFVRYNLSTGYDLAVRRVLTQEETDAVAGGAAGVFVSVADYSS